MTALREEYPYTSVETLCSLFGKRRQWYYKKSIFVVSYNHIRPHMSIGMMAPMEVYLGGSALSIVIQVDKRFSMA